jgi:predicted nuclease of predicted toxin-antitoxin system
MAVIHFFIDNCVADSVGKVLRVAGHDVVFLRDSMPKDTKDPVIAVACSENAKVLVTHDKDFREIAKALNMTQKEYRMNLHRISLRCAEPVAASRISDALSLIEFEWDRCEQGKTQMVIEITNVAIRVLR